jgi:hypothetical protein
LSLFQNPVGFETGFRRKLPIPYMLSIYGFRNFLRGKKLFQKLKFWNSLHSLKQYFTHPPAAPLLDRLTEGLVITMVENSIKVLDAPNDYDIRVNLYSSPKESGLYPLPAVNRLTLRRKAP